MAHYRIHRIKDTPKESFRWAAHTGGLAIVKIKDYELGREVEAATAYAAWHVLRASEHPLRPGDLLEQITEEGTAGVLQILKYTGFDSAQWHVPEPKPNSEILSAGMPGNTSMNEEAAVRLN
jgi:hypothetical protein